MTNLDRWILGSCGLAIAASAAVGVALTAQRPAVEPWVKDAQGWFDRERMTVKDPPPARTSSPDPWSRTRAGRERTSSWAMYGAPAIVEGPPKTVDPVEVRIDPVAVPAVEGSGLGGVTVSWTLKDPVVRLEPHEKPKPAEAKGFTIERSRDGGPFEQVATVDRKERSWMDREAPWRATVRYRVLVNGLMEPRARWEKSGREIRIPWEPGTAEARTPSPFRVKLVGGDARIGIFRVETYDRAAKAWKGREHPVRPSGEIGPSGWRLAALAFEKSSLAAEAVDDGGVTRVLSTKD
jgi:hypothetical protein